MSLNFMVFYNLIYSSSRFNLPVYLYIVGKLPRDLSIIAKNNRWIKYFKIFIIYVSFYFYIFAAEYSPLINYNILAGELKHR